MTPTQDIVTEGLMTVAEAAKFLAVGRTLLYAMMEAGELPYVKLGRRRCIPRRAVVELAATNLRGGWAVAPKPELDAGLQTAGGQ
jgi:excisionase family DNA binding protein